MKEPKKERTGSKERRKHPRFEIDQVVELSYGKETFAQATGINLSEQGILCRTRDELQPYGRVFLMFHVPVGDTRKTIRCEGIVLRSVKDGEDYHTAVEFANLRSEDQSVIRTYEQLVHSSKS